MEDFSSFYRIHAAQEKQGKLQRYHCLNRYAQKGKTLLVGSSLMEQFPIHELLLDRGTALTVYNRGVGGFTTEELLDNMDVCIFELAPRRIFMNIGTNDLNEPDADDSRLLRNLEKLIREIQTRLPEAELNLLAYYPVNPDAAPNEWLRDAIQNRSNERIRNVNQKVALLAERFGIRFLDLNRGLLDEQGQLRRDFSVDGIHMYASGYQEVLNLLLPYLLEACPD